MSGKTTDRIRTWLDSQLAALAPGTMLPPGRELAGMFGVSLTTVQRVLAEYRAAGTLERIAGRGTFIPGRQPDLPPVTRHVQARRSAENIAEMLYAQICDGTFKSGNLLPSIKYLSMDWNISRSTAVTAYRILRERGCVHKLGRSYVAGHPNELAPERPGRTLHFFYGTHPKAIGNFFRDHAFAFAYRVLEHEMGKENYRARYHRIDEFDRMVRDWIRSGHYPSTIVLAYMKNQQAYDALQPQLKRLMDLGGEKKPAVLVGGKITRAKIGGVVYMNSGHLATEAFRELARFTARGHYRKVVVCFDDRRKDHLNLSFISSLTLWAEVRHRCRDTGIAFNVRPPDEYLGKTDDYVARKLEKPYGPEITGILSKYRPGALPDVKEHIRLHRNLDAAYKEARADELWVFPHDITAVEALDYWERKGRNRAQMPSVFGMENDARFLYRGLSACVPDHATLGYLMAQALLRTYPVPKSSHGYLRAPVLLIRRRT